MNEKEQLTNEEVENNSNEDVNENVVDENSATEPEIEEAIAPSPEQLIQASNDKFLRLFAEFENFRRRNAKERMELFSTANKDIMTILPVLDDFERAIKQAQCINFQITSRQIINCIKYCPQRG